MSLSASGRRKAPALEEPLLLPRVVAKGHHADEAAALVVRGERGVHLLPDVAAGGGVGEVAVVVDGHRDDHPLSKRPNSRHKDWSGIKASILGHLR